MSDNKLPENKLPENLLDLFYEIALKAGKIALEYYGSQLKIEYKSDFSPLTLADKLVDGVIFEALQKAYPNIPIISEERPNDHPDETIKGRFFLIDPIDGTKEFIQKKDNFTINIALIEGGKAIAGLLYAPAIGRLFLADVKAQICLEHSVPISFDENCESKLHKTKAICHHLSAPKTSDCPYMLTSASHCNLNDEVFISLNGFDEEEIKRIGSSLKFALLAAGEGQVYPRFNRTMEWDTAAGQAILEAAGGSVTDFSGNPLSYGKLGLENGNFIAKSASAPDLGSFKLP